MSGTFIARRLAGPTGAVDIARVARPQLTVMAAQCAAGVGNLAFAVVLSRVFDRSDYAQIVAFLAVYFLLHVPAAALTAAGALAPDRLERVVRQVVGAAAAAGLATVGASVAIARVLEQHTEITNFDLAKTSCPGSFRTP